MTTAVQLAQSVAPGVSLGFKNRIINGGMTIDQRNAGAAVTVDGAEPYTLDRWVAADSTDGAFTAQQVTDAPAGFTYSIKATVTTADASIGATQYAFLRQKIEGNNIADLAWGTASALPVTVSFWVKSSVTGTYSVSIFNESGGRYSYASTYTVNSANTWEKKTITVPGATVGTWLTNNNIGLFLDLSLACGSTYIGAPGSWANTLYLAATGQTNWMATNGNTFNLTGVQLEVGTAATSFEFRDYGRELMMCQRYCYSLGKTDSNTYYAFGVSTATSTTSTFGIIKFPVNMRTVPSFTSSAANTFFADPGVTNWTNIVLDQMSDTTGIVLFTGGSGTSAGYGGRLLANASSGAYIIWSAEL